MVWQALEGRFSLGSLAMFYQAFSQGQKLMGSMLENLDARSISMACSWGISAS